MYIISCAVCGVDVQARGSRQKYCSGRCKERGKPSRRGVFCSVCGDEMVAGRDTARDGTAAHNKCRSNIDLPHGAGGIHGSSGYDGGCRCDVCRAGKAAAMRAFYARRLEQDGFSYSMRLRRVKRGNLEINNPDCSVCGERLETWSDSEVPRHARCKLGYIPGRDVLHAFLVERDGWVCQICFEAIDQDAHYLDNWSASIDHVIPRSHQLVPDHSPENTRLAHRWCNSVRGDLSHYSDEDLRVG